MAVTSTLVKITPHSLALQLDHNGAAGDQITFTRAALLALQTVAGPLRELLSDADIEASVAAMDQALLGRAPAAPDLTDLPHCQTTLTVIAGQTIPEVDIAVGPVLAVRMTPATAATVLMVIKFQHTIPR